MKRLTKWCLGLTGTLLAAGLLLRGLGFVMGGRSESDRYFAEHMTAALEVLEGHFGPISVDPEGVHVGGVNGVHVDQSGVHVGGENGINVDSSGVCVGGENGVSVDSGGVRVGGEHGVLARHHGESGHSGKGQLLESGELTGITGVEAELSWGDLLLLEGETFSLTLEWDLSGYAMSYQVEEGVLKVEDESWGHAFDGTVISACRMTLTVPAGTELNKLDLSTDMGDIQVDADLMAGEAELSTDLGNISCQGLLAKEMEFESELGDVSVTVPSGCEGLSYSLSAGLGEVTVDGQPQHNPALVVAPGEKYYLEANSDLGDVSLQLS